MLTKFDKNGNEVKLVEEKDTFISDETKFKNISTVTYDGVVGLGSIDLDSYNAELKNSLKLEYERIRTSYGRGVYMFLYKIGGSFGTCIMTVVSNLYGGYVIFGYIPFEEVRLLNGIWTQ